MSNKNLHTREVYSASFNSVCEVISSYLVNIYYHHFYAEAVKYRDEKRTPSITEGYRHAIYAFTDAMNVKSKRYVANHYTKMLNGITDYFRVYTAYTAINVSECIDRIIKEFVPADYYPIMTKEKKRGALRDILMSVINEFSITVVKEYITDIIDKHEQTENIQVLKDDMIDLFISKRDILYRRFLNTKINPKGDVVERDLAVKMREDLTKLNKENKTLISAADKAKSLLDDREQLLTKVVGGFRKMKYEVESLRNECSVLKNTATQQTAEIKRLRDELARQNKAQSHNAGQNQNANQGQNQNANQGQSHNAGQNQNANQGQNQNANQGQNQNANQGQNQNANQGRNASHPRDASQSHNASQNQSQDGSQSASQTQSVKNLVHSVPPLNVVADQTPDDDFDDNAPASKILEKRKTRRAAAIVVKQGSMFDENNTSLDDY